MQVTPKQAESFTDTIKEAVKKTESTVLDFLINNDLISSDALNKYTEFKYGDTGYNPDAKDAEVPIIIFPVPVTKFLPAKLPIEILSFPSVM